MRGGRSLAETMRCERADSFETSLANAQLDEEEQEMLRVRQEMEARMMPKREPSLDEFLKVRARG